MAIDSAQKRFSMMGIGQPHVFGVYPSVSGISAAERAAFINLYSGITLASPVTVTLPKPAVPSFTTQDWRSLVTAYEPDFYEKEVVYEFPHGRKFKRP